MSTVAANFYDWVWNKSWIGKDVQVSVLSFQHLTMAAIRCQSLWSLLIGSWSWWPAPQTYRYLAIHSKSTIQGYMLHTLMREPLQHAAWWSKPWPVIMCSYMPTRAYHDVIAIVADNKDVIKCSW